MHALLIMKEVGRTWQALDPAEKSIYEEAAKLDKQRFQLETKEFEKELQNVINNKKVGEDDSQEESKSNSEVEHQSNDVEMTLSDGNYPSDTQKLFQVSSNTSRLKLAYCSFSKLVRFFLLIFRHTKISKTSSLNYLQVMSGRRLVPDGLQ